MELQAFFLSAVSAAVTGGQVAVDGDVDWDELLSLCYAQKLTAPVFGALRASMPDAVRAQWRSAAMRDAALQTRRTALFLETYRALLARGFQPMVVKGILCRETYPEPDARISSDEDLYVRREDYAGFHQALLDVGLRGETPDYANAHEARYDRVGLMVEGHWEFFPQDNAALNALNTLNDGFWQRSEVREVEGVPMRVLDATDHMSFLLLHAFKHFINSGVGVRQICDVAQWSKAYAIDWDRVRETMRLAHAEIFAGAVFDAGARYFGMTPPAGWRCADSAALLSDALSGGIYGSSDMSRKHSGSMTLAAVEDAKRANRVGALARTVFPNRAVMELSFPWVKKSALLLPGAWGVRIWRYLRSQGDGNSAAESVKIGAERMELLRQYEVI